MQKATHDFVLAQFKWKLRSIVLSSMLMVIELLGIAVISQAEPGVWTKKAEMPTPRWVLSTVVVNNKIYTVGGGDAVSALSTVEVYDPVMDTWTERARMPTPRWALSAVVVNNKIYAIGGTGQRVLSTVEEYDPMTDTWAKKASMPTKRSYLSTAVVNNKIYAIGGSSDNLFSLSTVEEYDPTTDRWTRKSDMPTPRTGFSTAVVNGKIYAIGGTVFLGKNVPLKNNWKPLETVEIYEPATDTWTKGADMPTARWALSTNVVGGKIYAIGGVTIPRRNWETVSKVEVYNPATDRWTKKRNMPTRRGWHAASVVNRKIYVIGGAPRHMPGVWDKPDVLSTVEEFDTGYTINAKGKLPTLWGEIKRSR